MTLKKLHAREDGNYSCPVCGGELHYVDGGAVAIIDGQLDMENYKPRYECKACGVFYREVLTSGYYDVFPLEQEKKSGETPAEQPVPPEPVTSSPVQLTPDSNGIRRCPKCHTPFRFVDGGAVRVVNGKVDMENTKPKYECDTCGVFYREVLTSGYYLPYPQEEEDRPDTGEGSQPPPQKSHNIVAVGELKPMQLKPDANGKCPCPRCGEMMDYVEGSAVKLVDGRPDMEDVWAHFVCHSCDSVYRRIVNTDYFQWTEK